MNKLYNKVENEYLFYTAGQSILKTIINIVKYIYLMD